MRLTHYTLLFCVLTVFLGVTGCDRAANTNFTTELDEPAYRRAKDMQRQGRTQEALAEFLKVINTRGDDAPESHLEAGIIYQQQIKDPVAAIYHYRRFRLLKPNSPQADLVRQRIDAALREFARTLPAQPLENQMERLDLLEKIDQLQRENGALKDQVIGLRQQALLARTAPAAPSPVITEPVPVPAPATSENRAGRTAQATQVTQANGTAFSDAPPEESPVKPRTVANDRTPADKAAPSAPATPKVGKTHVIAAGETLAALAQRYYGNRSRWREIFAANRDQLPSEKSTLHIGMELKIP